MKKLFFSAIMLVLLQACTSNTESNTTGISADSAGYNLVEREGAAGPDTAVKITQSYAKMVATEAYFWAWPMVNIYNRRLAFAQAPAQGLLRGTMPLAPLNKLSMLHNYIDPAERVVACPNQDVVYGASILALDSSAVVVQVPDFGKRFWVYQVVDIRSDAFAEIGAMYNTQPGFFLIVGPAWKGDVPKGITKVFRSKTNTAFVGPRVFLSDDPDDLKEVQQAIQAINVYPLSEFDGKMKKADWTQLPAFPAHGGGNEEVHWVVPEKFFDQLPTVLTDAPPLPGEAARYAQVLAVIAAAKKDANLKKVMIQAGKDADEELIKPVFEFRNFGIQLPYHWSTINNGAAFGTDYFTRTATAKSNILVNPAKETKYFYQDMDINGLRLNSASKYTITFAKGGTPPVSGFWSLTMYNKYHLFEPNGLNRFSLGTKNKNMRYNTDGSLTIFIQSTPPAADQMNNWLPTPKNDVFTLYLRAYWPGEAVISGAWTPPGVVKVK